MGFKVDVPADIIPDRYIVSLKPFLSRKEVESHCSAIERHCSEHPIASTTSAPPERPLGSDTGDDSVESTFRQFTIGETPAQDVMGAASVPSIHTFRGYFGLFSQATLEEIEGSPDVCTDDSQSRIRIC